MTSTGARVLGVGALAPALGLAAHVGAGGGLPAGSPSLVVVAVLTAGAAALVVRRRVGVGRLAVVLGLGQLGWHVALGADMGAGTGAPMPTAHGAAAVAMPPSSGMLAAHAAAALVTALGAAGADRAVAALVAEGVRGALGLLRAPTPSPRPRARRAPVRRPVRIPALGVSLRTRPLRGPPVRPACA